MESVIGRLTPGYRQVLDTILRDGPSSRAEIAQRTRFTRAAVTNMVQDLADMGLVIEQPARRGQRGQPARPVALSGKAGFAVGVNFSHSYLELALVDLAGAVIASDTTKLAAAEPEAIAATVSNRLKRIAAAEGLDPARMLGVGFSIPGDFYPDGSLAAHPSFPELRGGDLAARFGKALDTRIFLENDGRASAIGERVIGAGRAYRTFMLVHLGHGVGGGLIVDGKPYRGAYGNAGILGQFYPYGAPRPSGLDLIETLSAAGIAIDDFDALENLPDVAAPVLAAWIARAADQLSGEIFRVSRFFGPEAVILAGRLPPAVTQALVEAIDLEAMRPPLDDLPQVPVLASALGSRAGAIGAASIPIYDLLLPSG